MVLVNKLQMNVSPKYGGVRSRWGKRKNSSSSRRKARERQSKRDTDKADKNRFKEAVDILKRTINKEKRNQAKRLITRSLNEWRDVRQQAMEEKIAAEKARKFAHKVASEWDQEKPKTELTIMDKWNIELDKLIYCNSVDKCLNANKDITEFLGKNKKLLTDERKKQIIRIAKIIRIDRKHLWTTEVAIWFREILRTFNNATQEAGSKQYIYNKITNPKTGRQVSIYGKLGKQILNGYLSKSKFY